MEDKRDTMTTGDAALTRPGEATFMGHPKGLFYLAVTEAWERFS
jgi:dipeptide/tripeptide permease